MEKEDIIARIGLAARYEDRFKGYSFIFERPESSIDPSKQITEVFVKTADRKGYSSTFVGREFIDWVFDKNKETGECASGTYFCMNPMVIVDRIDDDSIRRTIDGLVSERTFDDFFKKYK